MTLQGRTNGHGKRVGYLRVSSLDQNASRQLGDVKLDKTFTDKASGKDTKRPQLQAARDYLREGDTLIVHSMDRLARNLQDLCRIVRELTADGVAVEFRKENLTFTQEGATPFSELLLGTLRAVAQFERCVSRERQREGIEKAKAKGKYKGRKPSLTHRDIESLWRHVESGTPKAQIAHRFNISRQTLYSYLREGEGHRKRNAAMQAVIQETKRLRRKARKRRAS